MGWSPARGYEPRREVSLPLRLSYEARCRYPTWMRMEISLPSGCSSGYFQVKRDVWARHGSGRKWSQVGAYWRVGSQRDEIVAFWCLEPAGEADPGAFPGRMTVAPPLWR